MTRTQVFRRADASLTFAKVFGGLMYGTIFITFLYVWLS
jgi:hypothetical protein